MPHNTIRATVLIETLPAAFQMEEILFELRTHSSGLNCGRWVCNSIIFLKILIFLYYTSRITSSHLLRSAVQTEEQSYPTGKTSLWKSGLWILMSVS